MANKKNNSQVIQWTVIIAVFAVFWFTGWHKPLIAGAQRLILSTGVIRPGMENKSNGDDLPIVDMPLIDENGNSVNLSTLRGKTVFLNFWATWCPPCVAEMSGIQSLYDDVKNSNVALVMVSVDDDFEKARAFKKRKGYQFPIYRIGGNIPADLQSDVIPTTYVIDPNGRIGMKQSGMAQYDTPEFKKFLADLNTATR